PVRVYFVCSFLRGLYCLKVCSFQLIKKRGVSILKLMGMGSPYMPINLRIFTAPTLFFLNKLDKKE
ncbi:hypothetical protein COL93_24170, partial [Bacillus toyonensis]